MVQQLRLLYPNAGALGLIPGQGARSHMLQLSVHVPQLRPSAVKLKKKEDRPIVILIVAAKYPSMMVEPVYTPPWQSTPVLLPGKFHGQRSLVGYSPWRHKESTRLNSLRQIHAALEGRAGQRPQALHQPEPPRHGGVCTHGFWLLGSY